jgi:signal peptide peptidase SppA
MIERPSSLFSLAMRSFLKTFSGVMGIVGAVFLVMMFLSLGSKGSGEIEKNAKIKILPNLQGVREKLTEEGPVLLEIAIEGVIGTDDLNRQVVEGLLQESREGVLKGDRVKGILLTIDSPGGGSIDSNGIFKALKAYKEAHKIPIIAYVDGISASGGLYISVSADEIWSSETSLIGSVGSLIATQMNFSKPMENFGVETLTLTAGKGKDILNPYRAWTEHDREGLQPIVNADYENFVNNVVANRPRLSKEKLVEEYGAKIFTAKDAEALGYVDIVGKSKKEALIALAEKAGVDQEKVQIISLDQKHWLKDLIGTQSFNGIFLKMLGLETLSPRLKRQPLWLWQP